MQNTIVHSISLHFLICIFVMFGKMRRFGAKKIISGFFNTLNCLIKIYDMKLDYFEFGKSKIFKLHLLIHCKCHEGALNYNMRPAYLIHNLPLSFIKIHLNSEKVSHTLQVNAFKTKLLTDINLK